MVYFWMAWCRWHSSELRCLPKYFSLRKFRFWKTEIGRLEPQLGCIYGDPRNHFHTGERCLVAELILLEKPVTKLQELNPHTGHTSVALEPVSSFNPLVKQVHLLPLPSYRQTEVSCVSHGEQRRMWIQSFGLDF